MSLVSTWVQAKDGMFYQNPVLEGLGWFVCFDDDDPPELVVRDNMDKMKKPWDILFDAGIPYKNIEKATTSSRIFNGHFRRAVSYWFHLKGPIPIPKHFDSVSDNPRGQGVYYRFKRRNP